MCYAGVKMTSPTPVCDFKCSGQDCLLKGPGATTTRRMLGDGMSEATPAMPGDFRKRFL